MNCQVAMGRRGRRRGYASLLLVTSVAVVLLTLIVFAYRSAIRSQRTQALSQLRVDYAQKENAFLRAVVSKVPNAAMGIMQANSTAPNNEKYRWERIFSDSLVAANAESSISASMASQFGLQDARVANTGNTTFTRDSRTGAVSMTALVTPAYTGTLSQGYWLNPGVAGDTVPQGYPETLSASYSGWSDKERNYPVVTSAKRYSDGSRFKAIPYPNIAFGYAEPGKPFVARRNWWAFKLNMGAKDLALTGAAPKGKTYVLSLYEIPSQLPISAAANAQIGAHADGTKWTSQVNVGGGVFGQRITAADGASVPRIAARLGVSASGSMTVGGVSANDKFSTAGVRESYEISSGGFYPISQAGDSGRVSFIAINRGDDFYDRFAGAGLTNVEAPVNWSDYSIGARQCAMSLDVVAVVNTVDQTPTRLRFGYKKGGQTVYDADQAVAIGSTNTGGYPFTLEVIQTGRVCIVVNMENLVAYLRLKGADALSVNNSIAINADYNQINVRRPSNPSLVTDTAVILRGSQDLSAFSSGFSLVTNFRLYLDDDFNVTRDASGKLPPSSLFAPEQRYGANADPLNVAINGQLGSFATDDSSPVYLMDLKAGSGGMMSTSKIRANLSVISDPNQLPPIYAMNWLTVVQEKANE